MYFTSKRAKCRDIFKHQNPVGSQRTVGVDHVPAQCIGCERLYFKGTEVELTSFFGEKHIVWGGALLPAISREICLFLNKGDVSTTMHLTAIARNSGVQFVSLERKSIKSIHTRLPVCYCIAVVYRIKNFRVFIDFLVCFFYVQHLLFHEQVRAKNLSPICILSQVLLKFST